MRKKKLFYNTFSSLIFQITTLVCGFIIPRAILNAFGSEVNGLVSSITQFLQVVSWLEFGVGAVVQSSLYKPLAENNQQQISKIIVSASKFFRTIARILTAYVFVLIFILPFVISDQFSFLYTGTLIVCMCISSFSQYYFGIVDRLLLSADQKSYIQYNAQTITLVLNTFACIILIHFGASIQLVKLTTSLIYLIRPVAIRWYINRHYVINRKITYDTEPIKQKWDGMAMHISAMILDNTDIIVLTLFSSLSNVSIYSVYMLVVSGVKLIFTVMTSGVQSLWGDMWARKEYQSLTDSFNLIEWFIHVSTVFIFGCVSVLIVPFVTVYTQDINDANYIVPFFAAILTFAYGFHTLRLPYHTMIKSVGHYKQTRSNYIIATVLNVVISIAVVKLWGLVGVAIGTLIAMVYQTIWMAIYDAKNILKTSIYPFVKQISVDLITVVIGCLLTFHIHMHKISYFDWVLLALLDAVIWFAVVISINIIFYKKEMIFIKDKLAQITQKLAKNN